MNSGIECIWQWAENNVNIFESKCSTVWGNGELLCIFVVFCICNSSNVK